MTKEDEWLVMGRRYTDFQETKVAIKNADHWQGYGFKMLAEMKKMNDKDLVYAQKLLKELERSKERYYIRETSETITSATGLENVGSTAIALMLYGKETSIADKLGPQIVKFITKRQYSSND